MTFSYEVCKRLRKFFGKDVPAPIDNELWCYVPPRISSTDDAAKSMKNHPYLSPVYKLHDVLSKEFCEAFCKRSHRPQSSVGYIGIKIMYAYQEGGYPAVEEELIRMMENNKP